MITSLSLSRLVSLLRLNNGGYHCVTIDADDNCVMKRTWKHWQTMKYSADKIAPIANLISLCGCMYVPTADLKQRHHTKRFSVHRREQKNQSSWFIISLMWACSSYSKAKSKFNWLKLDFSSQKLKRVLIKISYKINQCWPRCFEQYSVNSWNNNRKSIKLSKWIMWFYIITLRAHASGRFTFS